MPFYSNLAIPGTAGSSMTQPSGMRLGANNGGDITDATASGTLYLNPYLSNCIWVPNSGGGWTLWRTSTISLSLSSLTSAKVYDIYCWDNAGTLTLALGTAWTTATGRANALTTLNGVFVNGSTEGSMAASRGIWLGSLYTASTTTFNDNPISRCLVNYYNPIRRSILQKVGYSDGNTATTWTTTSTTWVAVNAGTTSSVEFISGKNFNVEIIGNAVVASSTTAGVGIGLGIDTTTTAFTKSMSVGTNRASLACVYSDSALAEGYHVVNMIMAVVSGTGTYYADDIRSGGSSDPYMTCIRGSIDG